MVSVGMVGLGRMGAPMARRLLAAGHPLAVHNRSRGSVEALAAEGATPATSPAEVAAAAEFVLTCLTSPASCEEVYFGARGLFEAARAGQVFVDLSTVGPALSRRCAETAAGRGAAFLDAPVSGGVPRATDGTLTIMVGGEAAAFERARPLLERLGSRVHHVGPPGAGSVVKLANQLLVGVNMAGVVEALVMAVKVGADPEVVIEVLESSFGGSVMLSRSGPLILDRNFGLGTTVNLLLKDLNLIDELVEGLSLRTLMLEQARQVFIEARALGHGDDDIVAAVLPLERLAGVRVERRSGG